MKEEAKSGNKVRIHYTAKLDDGSVLQTSTDGGPVEFTLGQGEVLDAFEKAIAGMHPGELKTAKVRAEEAYGPYREDLKLVVDRSMLPTEPAVGKQYGMQFRDGSFHRATVLEISGSEVTLDANDPLAGKDITYEIELLEIH